MFDWLQYVGDETMQVAALLAFLAITGFVTTRGRWGFLIGGVICALILGRIAQIIAFDGARFPFARAWPAGVIISLVVVGVVAFALLIDILRSMMPGNRNGSGRGFMMDSLFGGGGGMRDSPRFSVNAVILGIIALILLVVPVTVVYGSLNVDTEQFGRSADRAIKQTSLQSRPVWRQIEIFLEK